MSSAPAGDPPLRLQAKVFWHIVPFLMLCYMVAYLDRINVGFAKLEMLRDVGLNDTVYGLGAGIFFLGYFIFEIPSNLMLQRVGARGWIARIMVSWGTISMAFIWVKSPVSFYVLRFLLGLAEAGFYPGIIMYFTYWYPAHRRAKILAMFLSAIPVAGILGNPLSGWIMQTFQHSSLLHGWQWLFVLEAAPAVLLGPAVLLFLSDDISTARWLTAEEKFILQHDLTYSQSHPAEKVESARAVFFDTRVWLMSLIYFCFVFGQYGLTFWIPTWVQRAGVESKLNIGLASAIPYGASILCMNWFGRRADRHRERRFHLIIPALMSASGMLLSIYARGQLGLGMVSLCLALAGALTCAPLFWSLPTAFLTGSAAAVGIAAINSVGNLAGFVSPYLVAVLEARHVPPMIVLSGAMVLGALATGCTSPKLVNH